MRTTWLLAVSLSLGGYCEASQPKLRIPNAPGWTWRDACPKMLRACQQGEWKNESGVVQMTAFVVADRVSSHEKTIELSKTCKKVIAQSFERNTEKSLKLTSVNPRHTICEWSEEREIHALIRKNDRIVAMNFSAIAQGSKAPEMSKLAAAATQIVHGASIDE